MSKHNVKPEYGNELAMWAILRQSDYMRAIQGVALPRNIYQGVFITLVWDNIGRWEGTTSGEGKSRQVNGMAVQSRIIGPMPQRNMK